MHDRYGFGRGRFAKIDIAVDEYSKHINHDGDRYSTYRDKMDAAGLDLRLKQDFIRWLKKSLGISGKAEHTGAEAGMEYTYTLMLYALNTPSVALGFTAGFALAAAQAKVLRSAYPGRRGHDTGVYEVHDAGMRAEV